MKTFITTTIYILVIILIVLLVRHICNKPIKASSKPVETRTAQIWRVTAYCPCERCCGDFADGITASGARAVGKLIAAPKEIPFGTWIDIPSYGYAEVLDRGGVIKGRRLDVLFPTHEEALEWGVKYLNLNITR